jgi:hypothetical protein
MIEGVADRVGGGSPARSARGPRRVLRWLCLAAVVVGVGEAGSAVFFHLMKDRFTWADPSAYTRRVSDGLASLFDAELGWTRGYATPYGERPRATSYDRPWVSAFGDSSVHGDEVADAESWEEALAAQAKADVLNFGVSGYGPDQALLMFRRQRRVSPLGRVVLLGAGLENINRVVNRYRPFYTSSTGIPLTKPRFLVTDGRLELLPNPVRTRADLERLADPAFVDEIGRQDYWYGLRDRPHLGFPYLRLLFSRDVWRQASSGNAPGGDLAPRRVLWWEREPRQVFLAILDAFSGEARQAGLEPVFMLTPGPGTVVARLEGRPIGGKVIVERRCRELHMPFFDGHSAIADDSRRTGRAVGAYFMDGGHPSPEGNRVIARALHEFLQERGLGPASVPLPAAPPGPTARPR